MRTIVVLGTGTDVGKTYTAEKLATFLTNQFPHPVLAVKPIESGVHSSSRTDAERLAAVSRPVCVPAHAYAFEPPISPHLAARRVGVEIRPDEVVRWLTDVSQRHATTESQHGTKWTIVETAGGVFSPISETKTNFDLACALEPSCWVLVASDGLGVLHNVRSTLLAMASIGRSPDIVLLNASPSRDGSTGTNREELERLGWARVSASIGRDGGFSADDIPELLAKLRRRFEPVTAQVGPVSRS